MGLVIAIAGVLVFGLGTGILGLYLDNRRDKEEAAPAKQAEEAARGAGL
jgi:hypothetical protein